MKFPKTIEVKPFALEEPVTSCWEAACFRNIALKEELKSLLFKSSDGLIMTHVPGDRRVNQEILDSLFGKVRLMGKQQLSNYELEKGRINPFTSHLYFGKDVDLKHIICKTVFENQYVYTNDDTLYGTIKFKPKELLHFLDKVRVHIELISEH